VRGVWADDSLAQAAETMRIEQVRRLPVMDLDNRLVGMISLGDLACHAARVRPWAANATSIEEIGLTLAAISAHRLRPRDEQAAQPEQGAVVFSAALVGARA
jgi:CBS-domain-containing membrane protein